MQEFTGETEVQDFKTNQPNIYHKLKKTNDLQQVLPRLRLNTTDAKQFGSRSRSTPGGTPTHRQLS